MTKRQLIDEIRTINQTADPAFLARFPDGELDEYLRHLRWKLRPSCREPWRPRSLRGPEPVRQDERSHPPRASGPEEADGVTAGEKDELLAPRGPAARAPDEQDADRPALEDSDPQPADEGRPETASEEEPRAEAPHFSEEPEDGLYGSISVGYITGQREDSLGDINRTGETEAGAPDAPEPAAATPAGDATEPAPEPASVASGRDDDAAPFADDEDEESWLF